MAKIYARKIHDKAINDKTGEVWKIEDVPSRWRKATAKELEKMAEAASMEADK